METTSKRNILFIAMLALACIGCREIEEAAGKTGGDPSQLLSLYAVVNGSIASILWTCSEWGIYMSILQSIRISGALCMITSPILVLLQDWKIGVAVGITGLLGLVTITFAFWKDLYPPEYTVLESHDEEEDDAEP